MLRDTRILIATSILVLLLAVSSVIAAPSSASDDPRVTIVLAPYLGWSDISPEATPYLWALAEDGAVGNLNVRNRNRSAHEGTPTEGALTFSAGSWAAADPIAPSAYGIDEYYEGGSGAEAFERMTGQDSEGAQLVFLGMPRTQRLNTENSTLDVVVGALGQSIVDAGGQTAAIGNSDSGYEVRGLWRSRPAPLVAMDSEGRVGLGDISTDLLANEPEAPFGFEADRNVMLAVHTDVVGELDAQPGPDLLVLDPGDLQRAHEFAPEVAPEVAEKHHERAVASLDEFVRLIDGARPEGGVLIIAPPVVNDQPGALAGLAPIIISGDGWAGLLSSSSTQRDGLVTNLDVAATVLGILDIETPTSVLGNPMIARPDAMPAAGRIDALIELNETAIAIDSAKPAILNGFITLTTLLLLMGTVVLLRARLWPAHAVHTVSASFRKVFLLILAVPPASTLMFVLDGRPESAEQAIAAFVVWTVCLWAAALLLERYARLRIAVAFLALLEAGVLLLDQWTGATLSFSSFLGYSPLLAARYYGLGNEGAALLMGAVLVGIAYLFDEYPESRFATLGRMWGVPILGIVMVVTSAAPFWGANVGVVAWGFVGFAVAWALMNGHRISWKLAVVTLVAIVVVVGAFAVIDLAAGDGAQTHLGRALSSASDGGVGELWLIVVRKAETNLRVLTRTNWSYLLVAVLGFLGFMRWRPQGDFAATLQENPHFSAAMAGCLVGGVAAYFTEDSGIVIPALILLYVGAGILYLMLARLGDETSDAIDPAEESSLEVSAR